MEFGAARGEQIEIRGGALEDAVDAGLIGTTTVDHALEVMVQASGKLHDAGLYAVQSACLGSELIGYGAVNGVGATAG